MILEPHRLKNLLLSLAMAVLSFGTAAMAQDQPNAPAPPTNDNGIQSSRVFDELASQALLVMKQRAEGLNIKGVAVVAFVPGNDANSWLSKMIVVGHLTTQSSTNDPGSNLLAIAYSKAAEMADTLKPSGSGVRPPMKGEFGWQGGWIEHGKTGWLIAAFSGGRSEDDVKVSKAGVAVLSGAL